jgi:hypothetical protein
MYGFGLCAGIFFLVILCPCFRSRPSFLLKLLKVPRFPVRLNFTFFLPNPVLTLKVLRYTKEMDAVFQIIFTLLSAFFTYRVSNISTLSGVISVFWFGLAARHYCVCFVFLLGVFFGIFLCLFPEFFLLVFWPSSGFFGVTTC